MYLTRTSLFLMLILLGICSISVGCAPAFLGRPFSQNPTREVKVGFDQQKDVLRKLGAPYRQHTDEQGNLFFVYIWSDGEQSARKCIVMFNPQGLVSIVNVVQ